MMLAVRIASATPRIASTLCRALYSTNNQQHGLSSIDDLLGSLAGATPSTPPVGRTYPPPRTRIGKNPLDESIIKDYAVKPQRYSLYCQSTRNNTITTLMDDNFNPVAFQSGGTCGFKKVNRSSYEAGYQCAVRMFKKIEELRSKKRLKRLQIALYFKGFGQGREAMQRALMTSEGDKVRELVVSVTDRTPIKIGGTRAKKARRL